MVRFHYSPPVESEPDGIWGCLLSSTFGENRIRVGTVALCQNYDGFNVVKRKGIEVIGGLTSLG